MPYPIITEYTWLSLALGDSGLTPYIRPILDPQRFLEFDELPDPRRPGDADRFPHRIGGEKFVANFGTELRGLAAADTPGVTLINENDLYRAAGFARVSTSGVSHAYQLGDLHDDADGGDVHPVSLTVFHDGRTYTGTQCVADAVLHFPANGICTIDWAMRGYLATAFAGLVDAAVIAAVETTGEPHTGRDATVTITPAGGAAITDLIWHNFDIPVNNVITHAGSLDEASGYARPRVVARDCQLTGEFECVEIATADLMDWLENRTVLTVSIALGAVAGNVCTVTGGFVLNNLPESYDNDGLLSVRMQAKMHPTSPLTVTWT